MLLSGTKFEITVEEDAINSIDDVLFLFEKLHAEDRHFYFKQSTPTEVCLGTCHSEYKDVEHYPLEVILPMIKYKLQQLPDVKDCYSDGDGSSYPAFDVKADWKALTITRTYVYAGK